MSALGSSNEGARDTPHPRRLARADAERVPWTVIDGLAVYRFGAGEPVLLMPGPHRHQRPGLRMADALIAGLVDLGRTVITFDPPRSGHSTRPASLTMAEMSACSLEALERCRVDRTVDALGHSMGGMALLAFAIAAPEHIRRLVLVGTGRGGGAYLKAPGALWNRRHRSFWPMAALGILQSVWPRLGPERLLLNLIERESFIDRSLARPMPVHLSDWLRPRAGRSDWHRVARGLDYQSELPRVRMPTLVLCGRADPQFPPLCSEELALGIPDARLCWFERSGHYPFIEEPEAFWQAVRDFLVPDRPAQQSSSAPAPGTRAKHLS